MAFWLNVGHFQWSFQLELWFPFPRMIKTFPLITLLGAILLAGPCTNWRKPFAPAQPEVNGTLSNLPGHPRILLLEGEEEAIREMVATDATWKKLHGAILAECDKLDGTPPIQRVQVGRRLLAKSRECLRRVFYLSYAYRMTGAEKYAKRAERELLAVADFSDWNPSHFLDVAEMTMGMAIGYDWLHEALPEASRAKIREAILTKGIQPSLDDRYNSWLKASHNWNQVCNAGMTYGALAIYEDQPDLARQIVDRSIKTISLPMEDYQPDGAYPEGYGYWGYGTSFHVLFQSAAEKLLGKNAGLPENPGFFKTASYLQHMTGPSGNAFNYSDSGVKGGLQPAMFWFASKLNDPSLLWVERERLRQNDPSAHLTDRLLPAALIWGRGIRLENVPEPSQKIWVGGGKNPVALMRTSWRDPKAVYVGLKAGSPSVNHGHMDVGSFVMEARGVRWAMDFGMQSYESLESKGVKLWGKEQDAQRWQVFRYNNLTHNTLTVDGQLQRVDGHADITGHGDKAGFTYATTDLSAVYGGQLAKAQRGVAIVDGKYVVVHDEVETAGEARTIRWTLLTPANVQITGKNQVQLTKDGQKLTLRVQQPAGVTMKTWSTDPPRDYDAPNPGTTLVGFEVTVPKGTKRDITVLLLPDGTEAAAEKPVKALGDWGR